MTDLDLIVTPVAGSVRNCRGATLSDVRGDEPVTISSRTTSRARTPERIISRRALSMGNSSGTVTGR